MARRIVYMVPEQYIDQIHAIGNQTRNHVIVCDYGSGPCVDAAELDGNDSRWGQHRILVKNQLRLERVEIEVIDNEI